MLLLSTTTSASSSSLFLFLCCFTFCFCFTCFFEDAHAWSFFSKKPSAKTIEVVHPKSSSSDRVAETEFKDLTQREREQLLSLDEEEEEEDGGRKINDDGGGGKILSRKERRREKKRLKKLAREQKKKEEEEAKRQKEKELREGESPAGSLHEAIDDDDLEELKDLLRWKPNLKEPCKRIGQTKDFTPIMKAAHLGRAKMIDLLLDYGANPNEMDEIGYSALMRAVMSKNLDAVKVLVDAGAVVMYVQKTPMMDLGLSALKLAQMTSRDDMVKVLVSAGANPDDDQFERRERERERATEDFKKSAEEAGIDFDASVTVDNLNVKRKDDNVDILISHEGKNETVKGSENLKKWRDQKFRAQEEEKMKKVKNEMFGASDDNEENENSVVENEDYDDHDDEAHNNNNKEEL